MVSAYIARNPLIWAIPETIVMTLLCVCWFLLFDFALESRHTSLFPISSVAFFIYVPIMLVAIYTNHVERLQRFTAMSTARDNDDKSTVNALLVREQYAGAGMRGFTIFVIYVFLLSYPWLLWGAYRWAGGVPVFFLTAWVLIGYVRYSCSYPMYSLETDKKHYIKARVSQ